MVLDDDQAVLIGIERLLSHENYHVKGFLHCEDLFKFGQPRLPACLILDNQLGDGMTGVDVHAEIIRRGWNIPVLFLTAHWDAQSIVRAIRSGADDFITKPFEPSELIEAVNGAIARARQQLEEASEIFQARLKAGRLTDREREIVRFVCSGMLNKEIADRLGLALVTVKVHRGRAMQKLGAGNPPELVRIASKAGLLDQPI